MSRDRARRVLLVGWDAADWRVIHPLLDAGKMPVLERLVGEGTMANLATLHPVLSPMLWTSIATGKRPYKHGVLGFTEPTEDASGIRPVSSLSRKVKAFVQTQGANGSLIYVDGKEIKIPSVPPARIVDPTGCGDAYRAGLLYGIANGLDWEITGRLASLLGSIKISHRGPQNHKFTRDAIAEQFSEAFGMALP